MVFFKLAIYLLHGRYYYDIVAISTIIMNYSCYRIIFLVAYYIYAPFSILSTCLRGNLIASESLLAEQPMLRFKAIPLWRLLYQSSVA